MILQLSPILDALEVARTAASDVINSDNEVAVDDQVDRWVFVFTPREDSLGGGARVFVAKDDLRVLKILCEQ